MIAYLYILIANKTGLIELLIDHLILLHVLLIFFRIDGILAIAVTDREGVPILLGIIC